MGIAGGDLKLFDTQKECWGKTFLSLMMLHSSLGLERQSWSVKAGASKLALTINTSIAFTVPSQSKL